MRILVVDDSRVARTVLKRILAEIGYEDVAEARDGHEALQMAESGGDGSEFDLVITDWNMPGMDGLQLVAALTRSTHCNMPILMVSSESYLSRIVEVMRAGAHGYIRKPFAPPMLRKKIVEVIRKHELSGQPETTTMVGLLDEIGFPELIQMLMACGKSGRIEIESGGAVGAVDLRGGEVRSAYLHGTHGEVIGDEAAFSIAVFEHGTFRFRGDESPVERNVTMPTMQLLIEAMKRRDEAATPAE